MVSTRLAPATFSAIAFAAAVFGSAPRAEAQTPPPAAPQAPAPSDEEYRRIVAKEPKAMMVVKATLHNFRIHPERLDELRSNARMRALLPVISGYMNYNSGTTATAGLTSISMPTASSTNLAVNGYSVTGAISWDFRELAFNPAVTQIYSLVGVQRDVASEVLRNYFLRRQLQARLSMTPQQNPVTQLTLEIRVEEYTAQIDALTGGWFSKSIAQGPRSAVPMPDED